MALSRFGAWLLTNTGKTFSLSLATGTTIGIFCLNVLPNTLLINNYKDIVHLYRHGVPVQLSEKLKQRFEQAIQLSGVPEDDRKLFKPFAVYGFDMFHAGTSYSRFGCVIGLPLNFTYTDPDLINTSIIKINNESVMWELDEGQQLLKSLVLSEKAQLYAIAREIKMADSAKVILDTFYATAAALSCYGFSIHFNKKLNLYSKPFGIRMVLYALIGGFVFANYIIAKDLTQMHYEQEVDKVLKAKDQMLVEGGREFYEKLLSRNQALRKLLGKDGEAQYSVLGNENYFLRQRHLPLIQRKDFFEVS